MFPGSISGSVTWSRGLGNGFGPRLPVSKGFTDATAVAIGDLDGDSRLDIAWGSEISRDLFWARNLGNGAFASSQVFMVAGNVTEDLEITDIDLDGDEDIVVRLQRSIRYALNAGGGSFPTSTQLQASTNTMTVGDLDLDGDPDIVYGFEFNSLLGYRENLAVNSIGEAVCGPAVLNASGASATMSASGSTSIGVNRVRLEASELAMLSFGYFFTSDASAISFPVPNSIGRLCLGGAIGRYVGLGQVQNSGAEGAFALDIDLLNLPTPVGHIAASAGETRFFQAWFRDVESSGHASSNFTDALALTLR